MKVCLGMRYLSMIVLQLNNNKDKCLLIIVDTATEPIRRGRLNALRKMCAVGNTPSKGTFKLLLKHFSFEH